MAALALLRRSVLCQFLAGLQLGAVALVFNRYLLALGRGEDLAGVAAGVMALALAVAALCPATAWEGATGQHRRPTRAPAAALGRADRAWSRGNSALHIGQRSYPQVTPPHDLLGHPTFW